MATSTYQDIDRTRIINLVTAAQKGDRAALGELFVCYKGHVLAIARHRLGDFGEAQELCQEVFLQAMQKLDQLRDPRCFGSWLRSITHRMAINKAVRRAPSVATEPQLLEATVMDQETPYRCAVTGERATHVKDGLSRLRDLDRDTLVAFYVRGQSIVEMSDHFDAPIGTIKRRLHVARKRLAREVEHLVSC